MTVTVDRVLLEAAKEAIKADRADSLSGWVNLALTEKAARERRLQAMAEAVQMYEREFGVISSAEIDAQQREDQRNAVVIREKPRKRQRRRAA